MGLSISTMESGPVRHTQPIGISPKNLSEGVGRVDFRTNNL